MDAFHPDRPSSIHCYITPPSPSDPALTSKLPQPLLFSLPLAEGRWFMGLYFVPPLDGKDLETYRGQIDVQARAAGIEPRPEHRGALSMSTVEEGSLRGLIEICPLGTRPPRAEA